MRCKMRLALAVAKTRRTESTGRSESLRAIPHLLGDMETRKMYGDEARDYWLPATIGAFTSQTVSYHR